jgi:ferredoxin
MCGHSSVIISKWLMIGHRRMFSSSPETDEEKDLCEDALGVCPVDAIGNDG